MFILAIDTSSDGGYVALFKGSTLLSHAQLEKKMQTSNLLQKIDALLQKEKIELENITHYSVCTGPGSFTGIRIGVITAKTLAWARSKPLIGYSAFIGRSPQVVFIGRRRVAYLSPDGGDILYGDIDDVEVGSKRDLDLSLVGRHLEEKALNATPGKPERVEITYPQTI